MPKIPMKMTCATTKKTDITRLEMASPLAAGLMQTLRGRENCERSQKCPEKLEDWLNKYRSLLEDASVTEMAALRAACPRLDIPEAVALFNRIVAAAKQIKDEAESVSQPPRP